jgi:glucokinase
MGKRARVKRRRLYVGVDVGGTKIQASLVEEAGTIRGQVRRPTPRRGTPARTVDAIEATIADLLRQEGLRAGDLEAIGVAVPGVVDPKKGLVVVTPNMNLSGSKVGPDLARRLGVSVALGNDCNLGILGEAWLGAAVCVASAFGIFVGTGIGGGFVQGGRLWGGARDAAAEVGHIVMEIGGPACGCGNRGCLEALASRTAIERDLRAAMKAGRKTVLARLLKGQGGRIRSGVLREALAQKDPLVTAVLGRAAEVLGHACLTVRHLVDPEVIILGGGVVEACGKFLVPIVRGIVEADRLAAARPGGEVLESALGDDAVVLGAVALARQAVGRDPFKGIGCAPRPAAALVEAAPGRVTVGGERYTGSIYIRASGKVKKLRGAGWGAARPGAGTAAIGPDELRKVCKGDPEVLFIGTGRRGGLRLAPAAEAYLKDRAIEVRAAPMPQAARAYNVCPRRKAALLEVRP